MIEADPDTQPPPLTEGQRRHLEMSLFHLFNEMGETTDWVRQHTFPGDQGRQVVAALETIRGKVREAAARLGVSLDRSEPDPQRRLAARASHWWTMALDCRADALKAYGNVAPEAASVLDPMAKDLAAALLSLETLVQ